MSEHWYDGDGNPAYEIEAANGTMRATTLRDARKLHLYPSVTTIMNVMSSSGLDFYREQQIIAACKESPYEKGMNIDIWGRNILSKSKEHSKKAAARGTQIHDLLEDVYNKDRFPTLKCIEDAAIVGEVALFIQHRFPGVVWESEASFVSDHGFGGKVDLHSKCGIVLDFKTKDTDDVKKMVAYDTHHMQTAAYAVGLGMPKAERYNLFISTRVPGLLKLTQSDDGDEDTHWRMFEHLLRFWQLKNKYRP